MPPPSLADRLVTACWSGDLRAAQVALVDGASVNEQGRSPSWPGLSLPLALAVQFKQLRVVVWLLARGADPNGDQVMYFGAHFSTEVILQLLLDAGGDVNRNSGGRPPLCTATSEGKKLLLLAQPTLDFAATYYQRKFAEEYARYLSNAALADAVGQEVRGRVWQTPAVHSMVVNDALSSHGVYARIPVS